MENIKKFYDMLESDAALQEKVAQLNEKYEGQEPDKKVIFEELVNLATAEGYPFSIEELEAYFQEKEAEVKSRIALSEDELEAVAGGVFHSPFRCAPGHCWDNCRCFIKGSGNHNFPARRCDCSFFGYGDSSELKCRNYVVCNVYGSLVGGPALNV